eukprot:TRINITY_DN2135_c0_g1_i2.p1 TRINITY_DN2135_c0_g1~~TRINITY_DN2135_c0_g1_i2.p1  ORF type:complete len:310 (-),score=77.98 TRINITY_DN2135_c0_g1_i2:94-1023(-)
MGCCASTVEDITTQYGKDLTGQVAIITGANTGIGKETARGLASLGCHVIMAGRSRERLMQASEDLKQNSARPLELTLMELDLSSFASIRNFANKFLEMNLPLNFLINNAGIMGTPYGKTADGLELQWGTCHMGHFFLTELLLPKLKATPRSRVICLSSEAHRQASFDNPPNAVTLKDFSPSEDNYSEFRSYGIAKMSNIWHAMELSRRVQDTDMVVVSVHPGVVTTELSRNNCAACCFFTCFRCCHKSPSQGASTTLYCALAPDLDVFNGRYFRDCAVSDTNALATNADYAYQLYEISSRFVAERLRTL